MDIVEFVEDSGGVVGTSQLAEYLDVPEQDLRDWAYEEGIPLVGSGYAFSADAAADAEDDFDAMEEEEEEDDDQDEDGE